MLELGHDVAKKSAHSRNPLPTRGRVDEAMVVRIAQRIAASGHLRLPAVPSLLDEYVKLCGAVFAASGRGFQPAEIDHAREALAHALMTAFAESPRAKVAIVFEAEPARPLAFAVQPDLLRLADAYERWIGSSDGPLFGAHPDARVLSMLEGLGAPANAPILDFGAGTGRNALALARLGYPVDAVEITPKFAEMLRQAAEAEKLNVRVIERNVFADSGDLRRDYRLLVASEVVPDFRSTDDLRQLFTLAERTLLEGGRLLCNVHLCARGYNPDKAAREIAQQCYSCLYTRSEIEEAVGELPFDLVSDVSVHDYERDHSTSGTFPPTPWYVNWTTGLDVFETDPKNSPIEMRWLEFRKTATVQTKQRLFEASKSTRSKRYEASELRDAVARRLRRRLNAAGSITLPAVPNLHRHLDAFCFALFRALGHDASTEVAAAFSRDLEGMLAEAFSRSQRSNVVVSYEAPAGRELKYTIIADPMPLAEAYEQWSESSVEPMFGWHPDAKLLELLPQLGSALACPVLDVGAGMGRNALHLAALSYPVDAVELTPKFARSIDEEAKRKALPLRVLNRSIFECIGELRRDYRLVLASGVAGDFRDWQDLRRLFEIADEVLADTGFLLLGLHVVADGFPLDDAIRQWGQQCCAMPFTRAELARASDSLMLVCRTDDAAFEYERAHLPAEAWPPSAVFSEWATARHLFALSKEQSPIELRWVLYQKLR